jgi:hypothetical protein
MVQTVRILSMITPVAVRVKQPEALPSAVKARPRGAVFFANYRHHVSCL